jgi:hypothetical protein
LDKYSNSGGDIILGKYSNSGGYKSGHSFLATAQKRRFNHSDIGKYRRRQEKKVMGRRR